MKTKIYISRRFRKGSMLAFILVIGICLALLGFAMLQMGFGSRMNATLQTYVINARVAADAGLFQALYRMNIDYKNHVLPAEGTTGPINLDNSNGTYTYTISLKQDNVNPSLRIYQIDSAGSSVRKQRTVHSFCSMSSKFDYALFVTNNISMKGGAQVDGYDSRAGYYGVNGNSGLPVDIGSNTTHPSQGSGGQEGIVMMNDVTVVGNVAVGPGVSEDDMLDVISDEHANITGNKYSMLEPYTWGNIDIPTSFDTTLGAVNYGNDTKSLGVGGTLGIGQTFQCNSIRLGQGAVLEIYGDVQLYITGDFSMITDAVLAIKSHDTLGNPIQSSLTLYVNGIFNSTNSNLLNNETMLPSNFVIYGPGDTQRTWDIGTNGDFYGVVYAPNVDMIIRNDGDIYGALASRSAELKNSGNLHYDLALADQGQFPAGYVIERWWEEAN